MSTMTTDRLRLWPVIPGTVVIGIAGRARSGKDTMARYIAEMNPGARIQGFAWALKAYCHVAFGMRAKDSPLLQNVGTDVFRHRAPLVWIRTLYWMLVNDPVPVLIIPDIRFTNEVEFVKDVGGYVVHVSRVESDGTPYHLAHTDRDPGHASETGMDPQSCDERFVIQSGDFAMLKDVASLVNVRAHDHHAAVCTPAVVALWE